MDLHMSDQGGDGFAAAEPGRGKAASTGHADSSHHGLSQGQQQQQQSHHQHQQEHQQAEQAGGEPGAAEQQQQELAPPPLTPTVALGLQQLGQRQQQLHGTLDELCAVGLQFLDEQRERFVRTLEGLRAQVDEFCKEEAAKGARVSADTILASERVQRAQLLVTSLGGAVMTGDGSAAGEPAA